MKKNIINLNKNPIVKSTIILIICSLLIKVLSLVNRVLLTRLLGNDGISLYVLCLPTIMLFISIAGFALNPAVTKIVSENEVTNKYTNRKIFLSALKIGLIVCIITILILLIIIKPLTNDWLKQENTFYPILSTIIIIPIIMCNGVFRGYFNGINNVKISAYANVIEQVSRIVIGIIFLYIFLPYGLVVSVTMAIVSMAFGEFISLIYIFVKMKKRKKTIYNIIQDNNPTKEIMKVAFPTTISRLVNNLEFFLEPIIYTLALTKINFPQKEIIYKYSEITAYAIPLITMFSFFSSSISSSISPSISKFGISDDTKSLRKLSKKALLFSLLPSIVIAIIFTLYSKQFMNLIYKTDIGANYVKKYAILLILFYLQAPLVTILQSLGKAKQLLKITAVLNTIKLILLYLLTFIDYISFDSLIISLIINTILFTTILLVYVIKITKIKILLSDILRLVIIVLFTIIFSFIINNFISNYLLATLFIIIFYIILIYLLELKGVHNE